MGCELGLGRVRVRGWVRFRIGLWVRVSQPINAQCHGWLSQTI